MRNPSTCLKNACGTQALSLSSKFVTDVWSFRGDLNETLAELHSNKERRDNKSNIFPNSLEWIQSNLNMWYENSWVFERIGGFSQVADGTCFCVSKGLELCRSPTTESSGKIPWLQDFGTSRTSADMPSSMMLDIKLLQPAVVQTLCHDLLNYQLLFSNITTPQLKFDLSQRDGYLFKTNMVNFITRKTKKKHIFPYFSTNIMFFVCFSNHSVPPSFLWSPEPPRLNIFGRHLQSAWTWRSPEISRVQVFLNIFKCTGWLNDATWI